ncbi:GtrA family protein [Tardiphaga sp. vice352]|uniref:GtrA family protein n=1 Tax=Tardiphaga sp. vice352 TaxID=2592816 RepID=UPI001162970A|nr:GtrA family protein [Tardiphaga sp. vice352]QDM33318.1 GtrA family protein [Tardiphaga sp. vice352]
MLDSALARIGSPGSRRFARFLVVGALNAAVGYGLFVGFVLLGLAPEIALLLATILGVVFNFVTTGHYVFGNRDRSRVLRFIAVYAAVYVFNAAALRLMTVLSVPPLAAQLLLLPIAAIMTFVALRSFVFKGKSL